MVIIHASTIAKANLPPSPGSSLLFSGAQLDLWPGWGNVRAIAKAVAPLSRMGAAMLLDISSSVLVLCE